jgi:hypothetical protein
METTKRRRRDIPLPLAINQQLRVARSRRLRPAERRELVESLESRILYLTKESMLLRGQSGLGVPRGRSAG